MPVKFIGFHIFSGSQNLRADAICESQAKAVELAFQLTNHAPAEPQMINIGGGFGIPYFPGDQPLDLLPIAKNLTGLLAQVAKRLPKTELVLELGRYIVGEARTGVSRHRRRLTPPFGSVRELRAGHSKELSGCDSQSYRLQGYRNGIHRWPSMHTARSAG